LIFYLKTRKIKNTMNNKIVKKKNQEKNKRMTFSFGNKEKPPHTFSDMKWFSTLLQY